MKKYLIIILTGLMAFTGCQQKQFREVFPEGNVQLQAQMLEESILFGDSVSFSVKIDETQTPLSTLQIKIVVGTNVIASEQIRTKDYHYENTFTYAVPFGPNMEEDEAVKVLLTATNVEGTHSDLILDNCKGKRPAIETMYLMPPTTDYKLLGKGIQMQKIGDYEFAAYDLDLPKSFQFLLAAVGTKFGRVDYTKPVFGWDASQSVFLLQKQDIDLITADGNQANNYAVKIEDDIYQSIDTVIFNTLTFAVTYGGKIATPIDALDAQTDLEENPSYITSSSVRAAYRGAKIYFEKDKVFTLTGVTSVEDAVNKDWMEWVEGDQVRFLGETGMYYVSYKVAEDYLVVEPMYELTFANDDILWVCGVGFAQPSANPTITSGWGFDSPDQNLVCRTVAPGVYQFTAYINNQDAQDAAHPGFGTVNFKYFGQHGWGDELASTNFECQAPIVASQEESNVGNWWMNSTPLEGIIRFTLDMNKNTTTWEKL